MVFKAGFTLKCIDINKYKVSLVQFQQFHSGLEQHHLTMYAFYRHTCSILDIHKTSCSVSYNVMYLTESKGNWCSRSKPVAFGWFRKNLSSSQETNLGLPNTSQMLLLLSYQDS